MDAVLTTRPARRIPATTTLCDRCIRPIVWAVTVAGPNGPGGKSQPFDPYEDLAGNVALSPAHRGRLLARALFKDEHVDRPVEYCGMPHAATCAGGHDDRARRLPDDVPGIVTARRRPRR